MSQSVAMKQPIAGMPGTKPGPTLESACKKLARKLDTEYRVRRNRTLELKNLHMEALMAERRGKLIRKAAVEEQAAFILTAFRQQCLSAPSTWCRKLLNISDPRIMIENLREMMSELLEELSTLPAVGGNPESTGNCRQALELGRRARTGAGRRCLLGVEVAIYSRGDPHSTRAFASQLIKSCPHLGRQADRAHFDGSPVTGAGGTSGTCPFPAT